MRVVKDDIETQKNGIVIVCLITDEKFASKNFLRDLYEIKDCEAVRQSMPYRMIAGHHCFVDQDYYRYKQFASFCMFLVGKQVRQHLKLHIGVLPVHRRVPCVLAVPIDSPSFLPSFLFPFDC